MHVDEILARDGPCFSIEAAVSDVDLDTPLGSRFG